MVFPDCFNLFRKFLSEDCGKCVNELLSICCFHGVSVGLAGSAIPAFYFEALLVKSLQDLQYGS